MCINCVFNLKLSILTHTFSQSLYRPFEIFKVFVLLSDVCNHERVCWSWPLTKPRSDSGSDSGSDQISDRIELRMMNFKALWYMRNNFSYYRHRRRERKKSNPPVSLLKQVFPKNNNSAPKAKISVQSDPKSDPIRVLLTVVDLVDLAYNFSKTSRFGTFSR